MAKLLELTGLGQAKPAESPFDNDALVSESH